MSESFNGLKKKFLRAALLKSAVVGAFCALLTAGVLLLILKPNAVEWHWGFYVLIGAGAAALAFGVTFLIVRPTDKKVAKRLDTDYELHEKVQTMVEFSGQEGDMLRLQRENTSEILKTVPRKRPSLKRLWQYVLIPVLACAVFVTGVVIPAAEKEIILPGDGYEITGWQETALTQLIAEVKDSNLEEPVREPVVEALEGLLAALKTTADTNAVMRNEVISTVKTVDDTVAGANTYRAVVLALVKSEEMKEFSASITSAVASYKNNEKINSMQQVTSRALESDQKINAALSAYTTEFTAQFAELTERAQIVDALDSFLSVFNATMANAGTMPGNKLYNVLSDFSSALGKIGGEIEYAEVEASKDGIADACAAYVSAASVVLEPQVYNCMMDEFIRNSLSEIFGISVSQFPGTELVLPDGSGSGDDPGGDDPSHSGGLGDGDIKYGSDDLVYDPNNSEQVKYGDILGRYETLYQTYFNDETTSASFTDEMKAYITQYFNMLRGNKAEDAE